MHCVIPQAASAKQREAEALVSDLSGVVQQQRAALGAAAREREELAAKLKVGAACINSGCR